jgi:RraA family protein
MALMTQNFIATALVCDASHTRVAMDARIRPMWQGARVAGPAFTVHTPMNEFAAVRAAVEQASTGDVLVVDGGAGVECALWGDRMSRLAQERGIAGVVIDGALRDLDDIAELHFAFAITSVPTPPGRDRQGQLGVRITCGGIPVEPGDFVYGDADGVAVGPQAAHAELIDRVTELVSAEPNANN